jgi:menaquinone-dependent protoporphyrinogen oxidase
MKIAILYISKHGTTEKIAKQIAEALTEHDCKVIDIKKDKHPDLEKFDYLILGSSIYAGKIQQPMDDFCHQYLAQLQPKVIGLFVCGMQPTEEQRKQELMRAFPPELFKRTSTKSFLGGEFLFEKMSIWERWIVRHISKVSNSVSMINDHALQQFISNLKSHLLLASIDDKNDSLDVNKLSETEPETEEDDLPIEVYSGAMWECGMVKSILEDAGIEAFLNNENLGNVAPWIAAPGGSGAINVVVAKHDFQMASAIVQQFNENNEA